MAYDVVEGFEFQSVGATGFNGGGQNFCTNGTGNSIVTDTPKHGAACLRLTPGATVAGAHNRSSAQGMSPTTIKTHSFYFRFVGSLPTADAIIYRHIGPTDNMQVRYDITGGTLELVHSATGGTTPVGPTIVADTWYLVNVKTDFDTTTHAITAKVDGGTEATKSLAGRVAAAAGSCHLGTQGAAGPAYTADFDDWIVVNDGAAYPIGEHEVVLRVPSGDGTHAAGTDTIEDNAGTDIGATTAYDKLNEVPPESSDYVRQFASGADNYAEVTFEDVIDGDTVLGVCAYAAVKGGATLVSGGIFRVVDSTDATLADQGDATTTVSGTSVRVSQKIIPPPGGAWDNTKFNGLKGRVGFSTDVSPTPHFLALALQYVTGVGATVYEAAATFDATGEIATAGAREFPRQVELPITAAIATAGVIRYAWSDPAVETTPQIHERAAAIDATAAIVSSGVRIFERQVAVPVTAAITAAGIREFPRQVALDATAAITVAGEISGAIARSVALEATAAIAAVPQRELQRAVSADATAAVTVAGLHVHDRAAAIAATADIQAVPRRELFRQVAASATAQLEVAGQRDLLRAVALDGTAAIVAAGQVVGGPIERSVAIDATAAISSAGYRIVERSATLDAAAAISMAGLVEHPRQVALSAIGDLTAAGVIRYAWSDPAVESTLSGAATVERAASLDATAAIAAAPQRALSRAGTLDATGAITVAGRREHPRAVAIDATAAIGVAGQVLHLIERSAAISATAAIATAPQRLLLRQVAVAATGEINGAGETSGALTRSAALGATAAITAGRQLAASRSASLEATGDLQAAGHRLVERSIALSGTAALEAVGRRLFERQVSITAAADLQVIGQRELMRQASLTAETFIEAAGLLEGLIDRAADFTATAAVSSAGFSFNPTEDWDLPPPTEEWLAASGATWGSSPGSEWPVTVGAGWELESAEEWPLAK